MKSPKETAYSSQGSAAVEGSGFPLISADSAGHFTREKCAAVADVIDSDRRLELLEGLEDVRANPNRYQDLVGVVRPWPPRQGRSAIVYPRDAVFPAEFGHVDRIEARVAMGALGISKAEFNELVLLGRLRWAWEFVRGGGDLFPQAPNFDAEEPSAPAAADEDEAPPPEARWCHLYAVEIVGVGTKVGISRSPSKRVATHVRAAKSHGRRVGRLWISVPHAEARVNELTLVGKSTSEYLRRSFDKVMAAIEHLPMTLAALALALLTACASPLDHEAAPELPAIETSTEEPPPKTPYAVYASNSLDPSAIEAAHTRQATRILNDRLGAEHFVWSGFADDPGCDTVLVTRGDVDGVYLEGCRWTVELADGGLAGDEEIVQLVRLLLVTIDGPRGAES